MCKYSQKEVKRELEGTSVQVNISFVHRALLYFAVLEGLPQSDHPGA